MTRSTNRAGDWFRSRPPLSLLPVSTSLRHSPTCRWLVGPAFGVTREYTRRPPIDNLERARDDLEDRRGTPRQFTVGLDTDRRVTYDLHPTGALEFDLGQPAVAPPIEHRQATDPQQAADIPDRDDLEPAVVGLSMRGDPHRAAEVGAVGDRDRADPALQYRPVVQPQPYRRVAM